MSPTKDAPEVRRGGWTPVGDRAEGATKSTQGRWIPGDGQAVVLNQAAAARGIKPGTKRLWKRAELIREFVEWGLARPIAEVRDQAPVPAVHDSAPRAEKSVTWIPAAGVLGKLDRQAERAGVSRNELLRRHAQAWLIEQGG